MHPGVADGAIGLDPHRVVVAGQRVGERRARATRRPVVTIPVVRMAIDAPGPFATGAPCDREVGTVYAIRGDQATADSRCPGVPCDVVPIEEHWPGADRGDGHEVHH